MNKTEMNMTLSSDEKSLYLLIWRHPHKDMIAGTRGKMEKLIKNPLEKNMDVVLAMNVECWASRTFWTREWKLPTDDIQNLLISSWERFVADRNRATISIDYLIDRGLQQELITVSVSKNVTVPNKNKIKEEEQNGKNE